MRVLLLVVLGTGLVACGDDDPTGGNGGGGAPAGGQDASGAGGSGNGGDAVGGNGDGGALEGGAGGCSQAAPCDRGVCLYGDDACEPGAVGECHPQNGTCDGPPTGPVCDCRGVVHEGDFASCTLGLQGIPFGPPEACAQGTFACGTNQCQKHIEVCVVVIGGPEGAPSGGDCRSLDEVGGSGCAFGIADCVCIDLTTLPDCGGGAQCSCAQDEMAQETVTIALP